jgi:8-oxo-dGTP diphosphatase
MKPPPQPPRVRLLIVEAGRLALIRRKRGGRVYYTLPGGGVEPGETFEDAGRREAWEELGVDVQLTGQPYDETFGDHRFIYYRAHIVGGQFGTGEWPDHQEKPEEWRAERGSYEACWVSLDQLDELENGPALRALLDGRPLIRMDRFNHLTLTVADPERSRRFYIQMLGLVPSTFSDGRIGVRSTHQWIEFREGPAGPDRQVTISFVSAVPLGLVVEHLRSNGVALESGPLTRQDWLGEMTLIALRDPDGNLIEVATYDGL